jgi:hypothetical protein
MRGLPELLSSQDGRRFLESRGAFVDGDRFAAELAPPDRPVLLERLLPGGEAPLAYMAHQTHADFGSSVVAKFRAARDLSEAGTTTMMLWFDMDRAGSDKASTTITWTLPDDEVSVRLVPQRLRDMEARFLPVDPDRIREVMATLAAWIERSPGEEGHRDARHRLSLLSGALAGERVRTLSGLNRAIGELLIRERLAFRPPSAFVSDLIAEDLLQEDLEAVLRDIDGFVSVVNETIAALVAADVDPQLHPLEEDYLPLHYSCPRDGARRRLHHERQAVDHFAVASCSCGATYRFHLGNRVLSLGELGPTGRWSPDVSLPVYLDCLFSGLVAGRSSALYGLLLGEAVRQVLGRRPIPMLVPGELQDPGIHGGSLLRDFLLGP